MSLARCVSTALALAVSGSAGTTAAILAQSPPVFDRTGLTGFFTVTLTFATEPGSVSPLGGPPQGVSIEPVDAPSLTTAVVDQLGLRLDSRREQMPVLVIDGAGPPTEN